MIQVSALIKLAGNQIVGKVKLQKIVYLLDKIGMNSGFIYSYHHYGPYSSALSDEVDWEVFTGDIEEQERNRVSDGVPYVIFRSADTVDVPKGKIGELEVGDVARYATVLNGYSSTELELAATAYWLANEEAIKDWRSELRRRKGIKTEGGRTEKALEILQRVGLPIK
jgi:uncharacterized protein YwgA